MGIKGKINKLFLKEKTIKQKSNLVLSHIQYKFRNKYLYNYPVKITIDPTNHCNLRCELCPTGTNAPGRKRCSMKFTTFKKSIDECGQYLWTINLFNWGEPFLNKEICMMIEYARERRIDVNVSTNLNHFNDDICVGLIKSGLNTLIVSLDGASQESVDKYQKGSNFQLVIENIKKIVRMKEELNSDLPIIQWRFLVNKYNENEIERAKQLTETLKIDKLDIGIFRCDMGKELFLSNEAQFENVKSWLPGNETLSKYDYAKQGKKDIENICQMLWFESTIHPDGSVSPCCGVWPEKFDFGNINDSSFKRIWNSEKYQNARRISRGDNISVKGHICYICKQNNSQL